MNYKTPNLKYLLVIPFSFYLFSIITEYNLTLLYSTWYLSFYVAITSSDSINITLLLPLLVTINILIYSEQTVLKLMYGMATITHYFRLTELVLYKYNMENLQRVVFVHWWHDCRFVEQISDIKNEFKSLLFTGSRYFLFSSVSYYLLTKLMFHGYLYIFRYMLANLFFISNMYLLDIGYRIPLLLLTNTVVPPSMNNIWLTSTMREFWTLRWNSVIQNMLHKSVFKPTKKITKNNTISLYATFFVSAILHVYPVLLSKIEKKYCIMMLLYFMIQPIILKLEHFFDLKGSFWFFLAGLLPNYLFMEPFLQCFEFTH